MKRFHLLWAFLGLLLLWQIFSMLVRRDILPPPLLVIRVFFTEITGELGGHFLASLWRVLASLTLSIAMAAPAGLILGQSRRLDAYFSPVIYLLYPIPKVVLVPIVMLFLGINEISKIVMIFLILFFQILVLVRDQAAIIRPELLYSVRSLGAGRRGLFKYVYFPACLPAILTAVRQSIGTAVAVLYIVELIATTKGLGYYIYLYGTTLYDYTNMYAGVIAMSLLGLGLYFAAEWLHRKLCPWQFQKP
ncbi:MAG: NitT/TauT family transport system permease protein [Chloroflexi bacterium]|nr:MAG: NitT/TauT family transport system permease protein [Chloroflexota bacterium]MBA4375408.1 ABC transporter permease [Anaerolinea sp.]